MSQNQEINPIIIGISSRALFDMRAEHDIYLNEGEDAYRAYQRKNRDELLKPGTVFQLVQKLMALNEPDKKPRFEFILISKNDAETGHRVCESIRQYGLTIPRAILTKDSVAPEILKAFNVDLYLSRDEEIVRNTLTAGIAAAQVYDPPVDFDHTAKPGVHFAFDGDRVLFGGASEAVFLEHGLDAFYAYESAMLDKPMEFGPMARLLFKLSDIKKTFPKEDNPIRISLVTARGETRALNTLALWGDKYVDAAYMLGHPSPLAMRVEKAPLLKAIGADIFFDDTKHHTDLSSKLLPTCWVPHIPSDTPVPSLSEIMNMKAAKDQNNTAQPPASAKKKRSGPKGPKA